MIGELRHRIKILAMIQGRDNATGAEINTIKESAEMWAKIEFIEVRSDETFVADQVTPVTKVRVTLRYRKGITSEMEVLYDGLKYKILSVLEDHTRTYMTLEAVQVGGYRDQSLTDQDGQTLIDASGNALLFGEATDTSSAGYRPPVLTFTNLQDSNFKPI